MGGRRARVTRGWKRDVHRVRHGREEKEGKNLTVAAVAAHGHVGIGWLACERLQSRHHLHERVKVQKKRENGLSTS